MNSLQGDLMIDFQEIRNLNFTIAGQFDLSDSRLSFSLNKKYGSGVYVFVVNGTVSYVGVTDMNLHQRMNGYKNPGPSQITNQRLNPMLVGAVKEHGSVPIWFLPTHAVGSLTASMASVGFRKELRADARTLERFLIAWFEPEWNRD